MNRNLVLICAALLSTAAFAQQDAGGTSAFTQFDADGDGSVSETEAQASPTLSQHFTAADTDGDGKLSQAEFDAAFTQPSSPDESGQSDQPSPSEQP